MNARQGYTADSIAVLIADSSGQGDAQWLPLIADFPASP